MEEEKEPGLSRVKHLRDEQVALALGWEEKEETAF
jgi:hypothetical protein